MFVRHGPPAWPIVLSNSLLLRARRKLGGPSRTSPRALDVDCVRRMSLHRRLASQSSVIFGARLAGAGLVFLVQALNGYRGMRTIESLDRGLNLTMSGKVIMIVIGFAGLFITAWLLARINWRSRDFNLKVQRRDIKLINVPKGRPAVQPGS